MDVFDNFNQFRIRRLVFEGRQSPENGHARFDKIGQLPEKNVAVLEPYRGEGVGDGLFPGRVIVLLDRYREIAHFPKLADDRALAVAVHHPGRDIAGALFYGVLVFGHSLKSL